MLNMFVGTLPYIYAYQNWKSKIIQRTTFNGITEVQKRNIFISCHLNTILFPKYVHMYVDSYVSFKFIFCVRLLRDFEIYIFIKYFMAFPTTQEFRLYVIYSLFCSSISSTRNRFIKTVGLKRPITLTNKNTPSC